MSLFCNNVFMYVRMDIGLICVILVSINEYMYEGMRL